MQSECDRLFRNARLATLDPARDGLGIVENGAVAAKTGTAELVSGGKVITNAWMAGYRGDVAFAVIVEGGESGSHTAGPILKTFLSSFK